MKLKGFDKFKEKTPIFNGPRIVILPTYLLLVVYLTFYFLRQFYSFPQLLTDKTNFIPVLIPLVGVLLIEILGFVLLSQMWLWRDTLNKRYGKFSYQRIFLVGLTGILIVICLAFNVYTPVQSYSKDFWHSSKYSFLVQPLYEMLHNKIREFVHSLQKIFGMCFLLLGLAISMRSISSFGIDYTTAVYIYFPEESEIKDNEIYSVLRHPMYSGIIVVAFGGFVYNLTIYSLLLFIMYVTCFYIHVHFIEEPELISRFGDSYKSYRKSVPPFFLNPFRVQKILNFIVRG